VLNKHYCPIVLLLVFEKPAKEKQREAGGAVPQKSAKPPIDTREELAKLAKVFRFVRKCVVLVQYQ